MLEARLERTRRNYRGVPPEIIARYTRGERVITVSPQTFKVYCDFVRSLERVRSEDADMLGAYYKDAKVLRDDDIEGHPV